MWGGKAHAISQNQQSMQASRMYLAMGERSTEYKTGCESFILGDYSDPEFSVTKKWRIKEKVDGTSLFSGIFYS